MPGRTRRVNKEKDAQLQLAIVDVLNQADDCVNPTIDWIKQQNPIILGSYSSQKMARLLSSLAEMGIIRKGKSKSTGRMVYRLTSRMIEDGYEGEEE